MNPLYEKYKSHLTKAQAQQLARLTERYKQIMAQKRADFYNHLHSQSSSALRGLQNMGLAGRKGNLVSGGQKAADISAQEAQRDYNQAVTAASMGYAEQAAARMANATQRAEYVANVTEQQKKATADAEKYRKEYEAALARQRAAEAQYRKMLEERAKQEAERERTAPAIREMAAMKQAAQNGRPAMWNQRETDSGSALGTAYDPYAHGAAENIRYYQSEAQKNGLKGADANRYAVQKAADIANRQGAAANAITTEQQRRSSENIDAIMKRPEYRFSAEYGVDMQKVRREDPDGAADMTKRITAAYNDIDKKTSAWEKAIEYGERAMSAKENFQGKSEAVKNMQTARKEMAAAYATLGRMQVAATQPVEYRDLYMMTDEEFDVAYDAAKKLYEDASQGRVIAGYHAAPSEADIKTQTERFTKYEQARLVREMTTEKAYKYNLVPVESKEKHVKDGMQDRKVDYYPINNKYEGKSYVLGNGRRREPENGKILPYDEEHGTENSLYAAIINEYSPTLDYNEKASRYTASGKLDSNSPGFSRMVQILEEKKAGIVNPEKSLAGKQQKMISVLVSASYMTEEEVARYNTILDKYGAKEADEYFEYLYDTVLPIRVNQAIDEDYDAMLRRETVYDENGNRIGAKDGKDTWLSQLTSSVLSVPLNIVEGITNPLNTLMTRQQDSVAARFSARRNSGAQETRNAVQENFSETGKFFYGTGMSMADSAVVAAISGGIGKSLSGIGVPAKTATKIGSVLGGSLLGGSAYNSAYSEALQRGLTPDKARLTAVGQGINEMLFESLSLDMLVGHYAKGGLLKVSKKAGVNWIVNTLVQGGVEGSEEFFTDIANRIWDNQVNGIFSEELTQIRKYISEGMSYEDAKAQVNREFAAQLALSFAGGAISGGVMGGGATFMGMVQNRTNEKLGKGLQQNQRVMDELRDFDYKSEYAKEIIQQKKLTNQDVADLFNIRQQELLEQYEGDIRQAVNDGRITQEDAHLLYLFQKKGVQVTQDGKVVKNENGVTAEEYAHLMDEVIPQIDTEHKIQFLDNAELAELTQAVGGKAVAAFENSETAKADANRAYRETVDAIRVDESLTDEQKQAKIAEAKQTRDAAIESAKTKVDEALKVKGAELKVNGNAVVTGKGSGKVTFDFSTKENSGNISVENMTREQRSALNFAKMVAEKYGVNIKVDQESIGSQNGEYDPKTNTITVSLSGSNSVIYTMSHELTHWLKEQNAQGFTDLRNMIKEQLERENLSSSELPDMYNLAQSEEEGLQDAVAEKGNLWEGLKEYERKRYAEHGIVLDDAAVEEEVVARCCESFLGSSTFIADMARKHFKTARNIAKYMASMQQSIADLQESAKDRAYFADESPEDTILRQYAEIDRIAKLWAKAVNDGAKERGEAKGETKASISVTDQQYMDLAKRYESGDKSVAAELRKAVDAAAKRAGYRAEAYHGTFSNFTKFDVSKSQFGNSGYGIYLGEDWRAYEYARKYDMDAKPMHLYFNNERIAHYDDHRITEEMVRKAISKLNLSEEKFIKGYVKTHGYKTLKEYVENVGDYEIIYQIERSATYPEWYANDTHKRFKPRGILEVVKNVFPYDGMELRNDEIVLFDNHLLKSADLITKDDNGNIIPLSERFNTKNEDIRYSLNDTDSIGNVLSENQAEYFKDSKARNKDGNLMLFYHGTNADFTVFDRSKIGSTGRFEGSGFNFTPYEGRAKSYGKNVLVGYLNITKPLSATSKTLTVMKLAQLIRNVDPTGDNIIANYAEDTRDYGRPSFIRRESIHTAQSIFDWADNDVDIYSEISSADPDAEGLIKAFSDLGYDGLIHYDENGNIKTAVTFSSNQFKNADNLNPTKNADIRFSIGINDEVISNKSGDPVMKVTDNGNSTMYSLSTFDKDGRQMLDEYLQKRVAEGKLDKDGAKYIKEQMEEIYNICMEYKGKYVAFGAWSDADVDMDDQGHPVFSVIRNNAEYPMNLDFSLVCVKRRALNAVLNQIIKMGQMENLILDDRALVKVNEMIRSKGFETACDLCFVEAKRFRQAGVADTFVELYNGMVKTLKKGNLSYFNFGGNESIEQSEGIINVPDSELNWTRIDALIDKYNKKVENGGGKAMDVPTAIAFELKNHPESRQLLLRGDFMSTNGFDAVAKNAPRILKLYNKKKGTGGPKASFGDMQYLNDIETKGWTPEDAYAVGGVRVQSFSDFVPRMFFDYCQMVADLSAAKLPAHAYTKEESFVKLFGLTGMKINMSLIPKVAGDGLPAGLMYQRDQKGNVVYKDGRPVITYAWAGESFDYEKAKEIQADAEYGKNCGTICVGVSDEHIRMLMDDPTIRMIIPYHKSSLNKVVAQMQHIDAYENYEKMQTTKDRNGNKLKVDFGFNQALHEMGDPQAVARAYLDWCEENGYTPKFKKFAYNADGSMNENYYKLLEDFALYDEHGNYCEQKAVEMKFPTDESAFGSVDYLLAHEPGMPSKFEKDGKKDQFKGFLIQDSDRQELLDMRAKPIAEEIIRESAKWRVERQVEAAQEAAKKSKKKASLAVEPEWLMKGETFHLLHLGTKVMNQTASDEEIYEFKRRMNSLSQDVREAFLDRLREKLIRDDEAKKVRAVRDRQIAALKEEQSERIEKAREQRDKQIARLKAEFRESREKMKEARIRRDIITVLKKGNDRIVKMLANPTENSHVPVQLAQTVSEYAIALNDILTKSEPRTGENAGKEKQTQKGQINFNKLIRVYNQTFADHATIEQAARENPGFDPRGKYLDVTQKDESLVQMLNDMNEIVQDKRLSDLDSYELQMLLSTMRGVIHTVQEANKQIVRGEHVETYKRGDRMTEQIESAPKVWGRAYLNETLDLRRLALIYSGSDENAEFVQLVKELNEGAKERARVDQVLTGMFTDLTTKYGKELRGWYGKDAEWIDTGIVRNGKKIEITKGMRVSLAMHVQNSGNMRHITNGGVTIPNRELYRKGKLKDAYAHGNTVALSESEVNEIISHMTEAERAYVEVANEFFHKRAGYYINRTSLRLLGYAKAIVENYFPIHSDANYLQTNWGDIMRSGSVEGWGSLKERREASNAIYLEDITSVVNRQIRGVALYAGLAIPVRNWRAVLNSTVWAENEDGVWAPRTTVQKALTQRMGSHGMDVLEGFLTDVQEASAVQSTGFDKWLAKVQTNYVKSVLLGNAKVALKQLASIPTANYIIPWKYLLKGMFSGKADTDIMSDYTSLWKLRESNNATEITSIMREQGLEAKMPWLLGWITGMDKWATKRLWKACELMVADEGKYPIGSDAYYKAVGNLWDDVIQQTQPNFTPLQRADMLRGTSLGKGKEIAHSLTLFGTQRMQNGGILIESLFELKNSKGKSVEAQKKARVKFAKAVTSQIVQNVMLVAIGFIVDALRGRMKAWQDDKDKGVTLKSVMKYAGDQFIGNALGSFLGGSEVKDAITVFVKRMVLDEDAYDVELTVPTIETLETMFAFFTSDLPKYIKYMTNDKYTAEEKMRKSHKFTIVLARVAGYATGLPFENAVKDLFKGIIPAINDHVDYFKTGEFPQWWLHQSGKLDSAKTAANYKEWTNLGKKGSVYLAWENRFKEDTSNGLAHRAELLFEDRGLTADEKAILLRMSNSTADNPLTSKDGVVYKEDGTVAVDFTSLDRYRASTMLSDKQYEGFLNLVDMGVSEDVASTAFIQYNAQKKQGSGANDRFRDWLFKTVKNPEDRAKVDMAVVGNTVRVEGTVGYKENGEVYADYSSKEMFDLYTSGKKQEKSDAISSTTDTPEAKAKAFADTDNSYHAKGGIVYNDKDKVVADFTSEEAYRASQMGETHYEKYNDAVKYGMRKENAILAVEKHKEFTNDDDKDNASQYASWIFKNLKNPKDRAIAGAIYTTKPVTVKDGKTYDENGYIYRDYTSAAWYKLSNRKLSSDGVNKRYEAAKLLEKDGYTAEKTVAAYVELDKLSKKSEWQNWLKDHGYTNDQIKIILWSRGWAKLK